MEQFQNIKGIELFHKNASATCNYAYFPIIIGDEFSLTRNQLYDYLKKNNINCRKYFYPITADAACFNNCYEKQKLDNARAIAEKVLVVPMYADLSLLDIKNICDIIKTAN